MQSFVTGFRDEFLSRPRRGRRTVVLIAAVILQGMAVSLFDKLGFGTDMYSCFNLRVSRLLGMDFGTWQLIANGVLLAAVLVMDRRRIGLGTLANMVLVGYSADFFTWLMGSAGIDIAGAGMTARLILFVPVMALFLVAAAFYLVVELGASPYDAMPQIFAAKLPKVRPMWVRLAWDVSFIAIDLLIGAEVGAVTLVIAFGLGPVIAAIASGFRRFFE